MGARAGADDQVADEGEFHSHGPILCAHRAHSELLQSTVIFLTAEWPEVHPPAKNKCKVRRASSPGVKISAGKMLYPPCILSDV